MHRRANVGTCFFVGVKLCMCTCVCVRNLCACVTSSTSLTSPPSPRLPHLIPPHPPPPLVLRGVQAAECLRKFHTASLAFEPAEHRGWLAQPPVPIASVVHSEQIFKANKREHFARLQTAYPDIPYSQMLFFDNEQHNISSVSRLGVQCVHCPDGLSADAWHAGLALFDPAPAATAAAAAARTHNIKL